MAVPLRPACVSGEARADRDAAIAALVASAFGIVGISTACRADAFVASGKQGATATRYCIHAHCILDHEAFSGRWIAA